MAANNRVQQRDRASARRRRFVSNDKTREKKDARSLEPLPSWSSETSRLRAKKRECELSETCARRGRAPFSQRRFEFRIGLLGRRRCRDAASDPRTDDVAFPRPTLVDRAFPIGRTIRPLAIHCTSRNRANRPTVFILLRSTDCARPSSGASFPSSSSLTCGCSSS